MSNSFEKNPNSESGVTRISLPAQIASKSDVARPVLAPPVTEDSIFVEPHDAVQSNVETHATSKADLAALADSDPATIVVRDYFDQRGISVKFDGSFEAEADLKDASAVEATATFLRQIEPTYTSVLEELVVICSGTRVKKAALKVALNREVRARRQERYACILKDVLPEKITEAELADALASWEKISTLFETDPQLTVAVLKHFIWQVKRKVLNLTVTDHLMPIIFSERQGTGKTTFAQKFLAPIAELASDPVALADISDRRSGDIFRYPVNLVDDIDAVTAKETSLLKSVLSSDKIRRRILQTSDSVAYKQKATFIGTSNKNINELVPDDTGHRRFAMLPFRDGRADPGLRKTVNQEIEYALLWRSVDPRAESPIKKRLDALREHQGLFRRDRLSHWLFELDLDSEDVRRVLTNYGVQARDLYDLMCAQTSIEISEREFGSRMRFLIRDPQSPFDRKPRRKDAYYYQLRKK